MDSCFCKTACNYKCRIILLLSAFLLWHSECFTYIILLSLITSLGGRGILQAIMDCFAESALPHSIMISWEKDWGHVLTCSQEAPHAAKYFPWQYSPNNCHHSSLWETHCPLMLLKFFFENAHQRQYIASASSEAGGLQLAWEQLTFWSRLSVYRRKARSALAAALNTGPAQLSRVSLFSHSLRLTVSCHLAGKISKTRFLGFKVFICVDSKTYFQMPLGRTLLKSWWQYHTKSPSI